ncbi:hypothetical protein [Yoonia sp.]|uniref:hypothetical protein n=1 Tax=Yoonia sp. TaxID=2212373 RepID=UPI0025E6B8FD|nr:hypothetical protein [Yoonia sp.]
MRIFLILLWLIPISAGAQDNSIRLAIPDPLLETGFMDYLLPRFSLKSAIRVDRVPVGAPADLVLTREPAGQVVFIGADAQWYLDTQIDSPTAMRFADWLTSDAGGRAITGFQPQGDTIFLLPQPDAPVVVRVPINPALAAKGGDLSLDHCGRCHVVSDANRMKGIGSTPSFALIRTFSDWDTRFQTFYVLKPHPAFTQITDVTDPFDPARPSPIVPLHITAEDLDAIIAFVATIAPADLGAPMQSQ